jgi:hypothetical protein
VRGPAEAVDQRAAVGQEQPGLVLGAEAGRALCTSNARNERAARVVPAGIANFEGTRHPGLSWSALTATSEATILAGSRYQPCPR